MAHANHSAGAMDGMDMEMETMTMYFYQSEKVKFLFESYDVDSSTGYFGVIMVAFILGFVCETLSIVQDKVDQQITSKVRESQQKARGNRFSQGFVFTLRMLFSYLCMLAVMTYNVGILFATVSGLAVAYFILGFSPAEVIVIQNTIKGSGQAQQLN